MNYTRKLAEFIVNTEFDDLPEYAINNAKLCILNWFGITIRGAHDDSVSILLKALIDFSREGQASVFQKGIKTSVINASLINGYISDVLNFDDVDLPSRIRPSIPLIPAILALSEYLHLCGKELLLAYIVGYETEVRIARAIYPSHYDAGWHVTGTAGTFGAAAGTSKLYKLDIEKTVNALGIAGTQAAGLRAVFGTMSKVLHAGKAAANGIFASLLAKEGFTSSEDILGAKRGFINVLSTNNNPDLLIRDLGKEYLIRDVTIKVHSTGYLVHTAIDAALAIKDKYKVSYEDIEDIELKAGPFIGEIVSLQEPQNIQQAKVSIQHSVATAFIYGKAGEDEFSAEAIKKPELISLRSKVRLEVLPDMKEIQIVLNVKTKDGRMFSEKLDIPKGTPENPLTESDVQQKFVDLTGQILNKHSLNMIIEYVSKLENLKDVADLISLCS